MIQGPKIDFELVDGQAKGNNVYLARLNWELLNRAQNDPESLRDIDISPGLSSYNVAVDKQGVFSYLQQPQILIPRSFEDTDEKYPTMVDYEDQPVPMGELLDRLKELSGFDPETDRRMGFLNFDMLINFGLSASKLGSGTDILSADDFKSFTDYARGLQAQNGSADRNGDLPRFTLADLTGNPEMLETGKRFMLGISRSLLQNLEGYDLERILRKPYTYSDVHLRHLLGDKMPPRGFKIPREVLGPQLEALINYSKGHIKAMSDS